MLGEADSIQWSRIGTYLVYKTGLFGRPVYINPRTQYLYHATDGYWRVSWALQYFTVMLIYVKFYLKLTLNIIIVSFTFMRY